MHALRPIALLALGLIVAGPAAAETLTPNGHAPSRYQVTWRELDSVHTFAGHLAEGQERELRYRVEQTNVTRIAFEVAWSETDDSVGVTAPDAFTLTAERPDGGRVGSATTRAGRAAVRADDVAPIPEALVVTAETDRAAIDALDPHASRAGFGVWRLVVRLDDAGNAGSARMDAGNDYEVRVTLTHYAPVVLRIVDLEPPPPLALVGAAGTRGAAWTWALGGLAAAAVALGVLVLRGWRRGALTRR